MVLTIKKMSKAKSNDTAQEILLILYYVLTLRHLQQQKSLSTMNYANRKYANKKYEK